jgi:putative tryptophan/tyrosine transport system substrate-binding protein
MRRRAFLGTAVLLVPGVVVAQRKTPVIGLLWNDSVKPSPYVATLLAALGERGYAAGRDLRIEDRVTLEGYGGYAEAAQELLRAKVDVIVTYGATATAAAAKATKDIPIVAITGIDPVKQGLAASLSRPAGNLTGVATLSEDLFGKRVDLLRELVPGLSRVGHVLAPNINNPVNRRQMESLGQKYRLEVRFVEVAAPDDIEVRIAELAQARVGGIFVGGSTMLATQSSRVVTAIAQHRIPAIYGVERYVDVGGLIVLAASVRKGFVRAAGYVDRILKGARPGDLAIEQTMDVELAVNLKTAKSLGITIPQSILVRADRVIQ